jgi:hypothetical protein
MRDERAMNLCVLRYAVPQIDVFQGGLIMMIIRYFMRKTFHYFHD